jgi:ribose-phosphate pyrophosphokinase
MSLHLMSYDNSLQEVTFDRYPDGAFYSKTRPETLVKGLVLLTTTVDDLTRAMFYAKALKYRGHPVETLILPYVPGARQDRINDEGDFLFTLASVAEMINDVGFEVVRVCDPHSPETLRRIDNCIVLNDIDFALTFGIYNYDGVIAPDKGAKARAQKVADELGVPCYTAGKTRDVETGKLTGFEAPKGLMPGCRYLLVDDICDGGGTFIGLAKAVGPGVYLDLYVTHGLFTKSVTPLYDHFGKVFTAFNFSNDNSAITLGSI